MDKLKRDINVFLIKKHYILSQSGGGKKHQIIYKGHKIYYFEYENEFGDNDIILINGGRDAGRRPCFVLTLQGSVGALISLERGSDCFIDGHDSSKDLVLAAFEIAKERGCTDFEITDNSFKNCGTGRFSLADMYFLTHCVTWYESILSIKIKSWNESKLEENRKLVRKATWKKIANYLLKKGVNLDFISTEGIPVNRAGSAMSVLNRIKKMKNEMSCAFFTKNMGLILIAIDIESLHSSIWLYKDVV